MWQSTISLRYVSYKNADSNLHERICAMAMMAKNLLWSCAPIVAPRPPINPQRPNQAMERTADRRTLILCHVRSMTRAALAILLLATGFARPCRASDDKAAIRH